MPTASHRRPSRSIGSLAKRRAVREAADPSRSAGLYANFTLKSMDWLQNHGFGTFASELHLPGPSRRRVFPGRHVQQRADPSLSVPKSIILSHFSDLELQLAAFRSKIALLQPRPHPGEHETRSSANMAKFLGTMWQPEKGHSAASGGKTQSLRKPQVGRPGKMSRAEKGKGVRHRHRQSAADEPISSFTHPSGRRRE